jgi:hypothetical protein
MNDLIDNVLPKLSMSTMEIPVEPPSSFPPDDAMLNPEPNLDAARSEIVDPKARKSRILALLPRRP